MSLFPRQDRVKLTHEDTSLQYVRTEDEEDAADFVRRYYPFRVRLEELRERILTKSTRHYPDWHLEPIGALRERQDCLLIGVVRRYGRTEQPEILQELYDERLLIGKSVADREGLNPHKKIWNPFDHSGEEPPPRLEPSYSDWQPSQVDLFEEDEDDWSDEDPVEEVKERPKMRSIYPPEDEWIELEDGKDRIRLVRGISTQLLATGATIGVLGCLIKTKIHEDDAEEEAVFEVQKCVFPDTGQVEWPLSRPKGAVVVIASGLELRGGSGFDRNTILAFTLFTNWLRHELPSVSAQDKELADRVERVIIAGNSIGVDQAEEVFAGMTHLTYVPGDGTTPPVRAVQSLDRLLNNLTFVVHVDLMPGLADPTCPYWPQQACLEPEFPGAAAWETNFETRTNPYSCQLAGMDMLVTNGLNVTDVLRTAATGRPRKVTSLDVMERLLRWQHLVPTAPTGIPAFPLDQRDPFVMTRLPHIFIAGNQPHPGSSWFHCHAGRTLMISVPRFCTSNMVALLDLETLRVTYKVFGSKMEM